MPKKIKKIPKGLQKKFQILALCGIRFRNKLAQAELWESYQLMDPVLYKLGYEAADFIKKKVRMK